LFRKDYLNTKIYIEHNYFESIINANFDFPMIYALSDYVSIRNNTIINSSLATILQIFANNGTVKDFSILNTNCSGKKLPLF
jgi:hypothetical protein